MNDSKLLAIHQSPSEFIILHPEPWASRKSSLNYEKFDGDDIVVMDDFSSSSSRTDSHAGLPSAEQGMGIDAYDMERLGKKQEFKRNLSFLQILGFTSIFMATWEDVLM